jgi:hypothetical protein
MVSFRISQQMYRGRKPTEYQYIYILIYETIWLMWNLYIADFGQYSNKLLLL